MKRFSIRAIRTCCAIVALCGVVRGAELEADADYLKVVTARADKIVEPLRLEDAAKASRVRDLVARHYVALRDIHAVRDEAMAKLREQPASDAAATKSAVENAQRDADARVFKWHVEFLSRLAAEVIASDVEKIKDGLTYGVLPITYRGYLELYPALTEEQKRQILAWLIEAREYAMDGGSADEKHGWFGKYKGRINNYLSAAGFNAKQAEKELAERRKAAAPGNTN